MADGEVGREGVAVDALRNVERLFEGIVVADRPAAAEQRRPRHAPGARRRPRGTQSLHTNRYDEALALPSEEAVRVAPRTQQILAEEFGVADSVDPLGGRFVVEAALDSLREAVADEENAMPYVVDAGEGLRDDG